jgi:Ca2+-binding RTX toxin-like protein
LDLVDARLATGGVTLNLQTGTGQGAEAEGDIYTNVERAFGSDFDDVLVGLDGARHFLYGGGGNDQLTAGTGDGYLYGYDDDDTLTGNGGRDFLLGMNGNDTLTGNGGNDVLRGAMVTISSRGERGTIISGGMRV